MKPTKTQQLQATASRIFGDNVQIEYKPGGIRSGWYISKGEHTYCFGKNEQEAIDWLKSSPIFQISCNIIDYTIVRNIRHSLSQLSVDRHELRIAGSFLLKDILYLLTKPRIAILSWLWCLGIPLKRRIGDYPDLEIKRSRSGLGTNKIAEILLTLSGKSNIFRFQQSESPYNHIFYHKPPRLIEIQHTVELQECVSLDDIIFTGTKPFYGHIFNIWLRHLLMLPIEEIEQALQKCHRHYNSVTAPPHPDEINNTIIMLAVWELLAGFIEASPELKENLTVSILSRFQPQESSIMRKKHRLTMEWRRQIYRQCQRFKVIYFRRNAINEEKSIIYSAMENRLLHFSQATVDHVIPLCQLVDQFLQNKGLDRTTKPKHYSEDWKKFHQQNAVLQITSAEFNQQAGVEVWKEQEKCRVARNKANKSSNNV